MSNMEKIRRFLAGLLSLSAGFLVTCVSVWADSAGSSNQVTGTINGPVTIAFTNAKDGVVPTAIHLNIAPYVFLAALAVIGILLILCRRRHGKNSMSAWLLIAALCVSSVWYLPFRVEAAEEQNSADDIPIQEERSEEPDTSISEQSEEASPDALEEQKTSATPNALEEEKTSGSPDALEEQKASASPNALEEQKASYSLTLTNTVTGNMGSRDLFFKFTLTVTGEDSGKTLTVDLSKGSASDGAGHANPQSFQVGTDGSFTKAFYLQSGQAIVIHDISQGAAYTVTEDNGTYMLSWNVSEQKPVSAETPVPSAKQQEEPASETSQSDDLNAQKTNQNEVREDDPDAPGSDAQNAEEGMTKASDSGAVSNSSVKTNTAPENELSAANDNADETKASSSEAVENNNRVEAKHADANRGDAAEKIADGSNISSTEAAETESSTALTEDLTEGTGSE
ncbi:MAG: hypothetical protein U0L49_04225 [Eubacterium sp.]|nr:hypothetical protein [Eubacterium sp.]